MLKNRDKLISLSFSFLIWKIGVTIPISQYWRYMKIKGSDRCKTPGPLQAFSSGGQFYCHFISNDLGHYLPGKQLWQNNICFCFWNAMPDAKWTACTEFKRSWTRGEKDIAVRSPASKAYGEDEVIIENELKIIIKNYRNQLYLRGWVK